MAKRTMAQTMQAMPDAPTGRPGYSAQARREKDARDIERKHGSVLGAIAALAFDAASDPAIRLRALQALAPYLYPQLKAIELSGPDGERLTVEVRRIATPGATPGPSPVPEPSDPLGNPEG